MNKQLLPTLIFVVASLLMSQNLLADELYKFELHCPPDVHIDCTDQIYDLDYYGIATITEDHDHYNAPDPEVHYHLDDCGSGYIKRKWQVSDAWGKWHKCFQHIYVGSGGTFNEHDIKWPHDYWLDGCFANTDPEDLPHGFNRPKFHEEDCAQIFYSYKDWVFTPPGGGSCGKILRKWKVIDWCHYDPNDYHPKGIWEHTQLIKIKGGKDFKLSCPEEEIYDAGANCVARINVAKVEVMGECAEGVVITNDSPFAFNNGADASGEYPVGKTNVCYTAVDGCGNKDVCCTWITVKDNKKPTPICYSGIVMTLGIHYDGYYRVCMPHILNKGSFDNCTAKKDLKFWVEPDTFTCADLGETEVRLYVEDASGNVEFCNTFVIVQDNMGMCPPSDSLTLNGNVHTYAGEMVAAALVKDMDTEESVVTDDEGMWSMSSLHADEGYTITAEKDDDPLNGVDMEDLVVLSEHLFGEKELTNSYTLIAADVDNSSEIDLQDFLLLRGLIVGDYAHFSDFSNQKSWRFIDDRYVFADPTSPWDFRETKTFTELERSRHNENFVAIKIGDLDYSYALTGLGEQDINVGLRADNTGILLADEILEAGTLKTITLSVSAGESYKAIDMTLDLAALEIVSVNILSEDVIVSDTDGQLRVMGIATDVPLAGDLLEVTVKASSQIALSTGLTARPGRAINMNGTSQRYDLKYSSEATTLTTSQARPNPFTESTIIDYVLPQNGEYTVEAYDMTGDVVFMRLLEGVKGTQQITINKDDLQTSGIYVVRILQGEQSQSIKIFLMD